MNYHYYEYSDENRQSTTNKSIERAHFRLSARIDPRDRTFISMARGGTIGRAVQKESDDTDTSFDSR